MQNQKSQRGRVGSQVPWAGRKPGLSSPARAQVLGQVGGSLSTARGEGPGSAPAPVCTSCVGPLLVTRTFPRLPDEGALNCLGGPGPFFPPAGFWLQNPNEEGQAVIPHWPSPRLRSEAGSPREPVSHLSLVWARLPMCKMRVGLFGPWCHSSEFPGQPHQDRPRRQRREPGAGPGVRQELAPGL